MPATNRIETFWQVNFLFTDVACGIKMNIVFHGESVEEMAEENPTVDGFETYTDSITNVVEN